MKTNLILRADNIDEILSEMTLREKATIVVGAGWGSMFEGYHIPFCRGHRLPGAAGESRAIKRLGVPSIIFSDGPAGLRLMNGQTTAFPVGIALAATRDTDLVRRVGEAIGEEARAMGVDVMLLPGMNLMRNPLCGRNFEYFSEDPALSGQMAAAMVAGVQSKGVGTSVKHYALNNQETNRFHNDAQVDEETMRNLYLENFRIAIQGAHPWTVMASYTRVNGVHAQCNPLLLKQILRDEWGYDGVVITDWQKHPNAAEKIAAGVDLLMPGSKHRIGSIVLAVRRGRLTEDRLSEAARRVLQLVVRSHTFRGDGGHPCDMQAHAALARQAGAAGCVLLKNEATALPLQPAQRIALLGVHSYHLLCGGTGSGHVNAPHRIPLDLALREAGYTLNPDVEQAYRTYMQDSSVQKKVRGMSLVSKYMGQPSYYEMPADDSLIHSVITDSDEVLLTIGRQAGEGEDRTLTEGDFYLSATERHLLEQASQTAHQQGKRLVVVLNVAGVIETASWRDLADAILLVWAPGQEAGYAVADVLTGAYNPKGRLPVTFPIRYEDVPSAANFPTGTPNNAPQPNAPQPNTPQGRKDIDYTRYAERTDVGHLYFDNHPEIPVAYPYGWGLSY